MYVKAYIYILSTILLIRIRILGGYSCHLRTIWASAWYFQKCVMFDQQRLRSACAYVQSDQSLCSLLEYSMNVKLLTEDNLESLSLKGGCTGSCQIPQLLKSHATAHIWKSIFRTCEQNPLWSCFYVNACTVGTRQRCVNFCAIRVICVSFTSEKLIILKICEKNVIFIKV